MPTSRSRQLDELPPTMREHIAENMKERIYSTITLLAVIAAHWQTANHHSVKGTVLSIIGAAVALWLATLVSERMSYRAVHGKAVSNADYRKIAFTSSGLLAPAIIPTLLVLLSLTGWFSLQYALMASMIALLLSLFFLSFTAGRKIYKSTGRLLIVSLLEMSVGVGVIALKLAICE